MEAIVIYLLKSAGILAIFFFSYQFFLKKETFFRTNRHYLLAGILGSLILPLVIFTNYVYVEPVAETFNPNWLFTDIPITYNVVEEAEPFNWLQFVTYVYLIGVLIFVIRFVVQLISLFKLFKTNTIKKKDRFNLVEINSNMSPFSFFNYIVYNPNNYDEKDLEIIINHEKAHSNQFHSIDILLSQLFVTLQWFNPIAWFYKKSIQQNLEFMADQFAISKVESAKHYQHTLLKASLKPQYASITNNFYNSLIKKRIIMLNQSKSNIKNAWKYFVILPALALFLMSFNVETVKIEIEPEEFTTISKANNDIPQKVLANKLAMPQLKITQKIIEAKFDKNTTDQELKDIATSLKKEGIEFSYKNVERNTQNEITGIHITFKDSDGNTGNYALSSNSPISTFYFFKKEDGSVGFYAKPGFKFVEKRELEKAEREEMMKEREEMIKERMQVMEERKALSEERRSEIKKRVEKAREERDKDRAKYEVQRKMIIKESMKDRKRLHDSIKDKHTNIFIEKHDGQDKDNLFLSENNETLFIINGEESDGENVKLLSADNIKEVRVLKGEQAIRVYGDKGKEGVIIIETKPEDKNSFIHEFEYEINEPHVEIIEETENDKNVSISYHIEEQDGEPNVKYFSKHLPKDSKTMLLKRSATDDYLKTMKKFFNDNGLDLKYSKIKRNKDGDITRIKVSLNDNEGNKSSATFDKGDQGISPILIGKNKKNLIIKSI